MKLLEAYHGRLGWKLFSSYVLIITVGVLVLVAAADIQTPAALTRHISQMEALVGKDEALVRDLHVNFAAAVNEIVAVAAAVSGLAAVLLSVFTTRRVVGPIEDMMDASRRIAAGDYSHRVAVVGSDELSTLANAFNSMAGALERTEERRMALIGDVAHELRTPLGNIGSIMEALVDEALPSEPATFLEVQHEVTRLRRLVVDLEELSRAEAGEVQLNRQQAAPAALVLAAVDRLKPQFEDAGVKLTVDVPAELPPVWVDASRIIQVLLNLLGNALQYARVGSGVTVRSAREGKFVAISVQDDGAGIAPEHLPHVFERFYRVDKSRSRVGGGSGIGLTIARHLTEAHGGRIWASSPGLGRGSTFTFTLPTAS